MTTHIFYENRVVGRIIFDSEWNAAFRYDAKWLTSSDSFPLSTTLPLNTQTYDSILPWLANLLPEGQQLAAVCRNLHISADDPLAILNEIGSDTAGAISIGEPASREKWSYTLLREH